MNYFRGKKKEVKQEGPEEKQPEPVDYNNLPLDTAPVAAFKKKVAQELYEPWMDEGRASLSDPLMRQCAKLQKKSVSIDSSTPKKYPEVGGRSKFAFADDYAKQLSPSLASLAEDQKKKEAADRERLAKELPEIEGQKSKPTPQPTREDWGPIDKPIKKHKLKNSGVGEGLVREPQEGVRTVGAGSSLLFPRATSVLYELDEEDRQIELEEFYAWVTNGSEHDLHPEMIERILFRNRQLERRQRANPRARRH